MFTINFFKHCRIPGWYIFPFFSQSHIGTAFFGFYQVKDETVKFLLQTKQPQ